jgi:hypothetical protein
MKTALFFALTFAFSISSAAPGASSSVRELFDLMNVRKMIEMNVLKSAELLAVQTDQPVKAKPKMEKFLRETVGYAAIQDELVALYAKSFSEAEVQDLLRFYKTPTGRKLASLQPMLFEEGAKIGQACMMKHQEELQKILQEFRKK